MRMSVLMPKDNANAQKSGNNLRERSPRQKGHSKSSHQPQQQNRDSLKIVNEKNAANLQPTEAEEDSESENLSPLLNPKSKKSSAKNSKKANNNNINNNNNTAVASTPSQQSISALHIEGVDDSIDDTDTDVDDRDNEVYISNGISHC